MYDEGTIPETVKSSGAVSVHVGGASVSAMTLSRSAERALWHEPASPAPPPAQWYAEIANGWTWQKKYSSLS